MLGQPDPSCIVHEMLHRTKPWFGQGMISPGYCLACCCLVACSGNNANQQVEIPKPCPRLDMSVVIAATELSNSDESGQGYPVQVRVYELSSTAALKTSTYEQIWHESAETLGPDLVKMTEHTVFPEERKTLQITPNDAVNNVAFVALFREPQGHNWYTVFDVAAPPTVEPCPSQGSTINVRLDRMQIKGDLETAPAPSPVGPTQTAKGSE